MGASCTGIPQNRDRQPRWLQLREAVHNISIWSACGTERHCDSQPTARQVSKGLQTRKRDRESPSKRQGLITSEQRSAMQLGLVVSASIAGLQQADRSRTLCDFLAGLTPGAVDLDLS